VSGGVPEALTTVVRAPDTDVLRWRVVCRDCGDVTREASGFTVDDATLQQAGLFRQRHLTAHLTSLATEMLEASR